MAIVPTLPEVLPSRNGQEPEVFVGAMDNFIASLPSFAAEVDAVARAFNFNSVNDSSPSTATLGTGLKTFTVSAGKSWLPSMDLKIASADDPTINWLNVSVDSYTGTSLTVNVHQYKGTAGTSVTGWIITLTAPPQIEYENSKLLVTTGNGFGSTNTRIRRFSVVDTNTASDDITYADSATIGATFTVNRDGWYSLKYRDTRATGPIGGISLNSNQLTTNYISINKLHQLAEMKVDEGANTAGGCETFVFLVVGDIIRAHAGTTGFGTDDGTRFEIRRVSLKGMGGTAGGGGGGGAPVDASYLVSGLNGTLTNERVLSSNDGTITVDFGTAAQALVRRPAITGDVSIPIGSNVATHQANTVSNAVLANMGPNTVKVNNTAVAADPVDLTLPASSLLGRDSTNNIAAITLGTNLSMTAGVLNATGGGGGGGAPTTAQYLLATADAGLTAGRVATSSTSNTVNIGVAGQILIESAAKTGDVTCPANSNAQTIPNDTVTNAKAANMAANTIKMNNTAAAADPVDFAVVASRLIGRADTGNIAAIPLSANFSWNAGTLGLAGVALWDGTIFKDTAGTQITFSNGLYTWAAKPAASSVPKYTRIQINESSFGGTHKHSIGPTAVSDLVKWMPDGGMQLLARGSGSEAAPLGTVTGPTTATAFTLAGGGTHFSLPANFFEYVGGGLLVKAKFRKVGASTTASTFTVRIGEFASANIDVIATQSTGAAAGGDIKIEEDLRITALGGDNVATFISNLLIPNSGTSLTGPTDKSSGTFNTNSVMYIVPCVACTDAASEHELLSFEVWWIA